LKLLQRNSGQEFGSVDEARTAADWQPVLEKATAWLVKTYPEEAQSLSGSGSAEIAAQLSELEAADWEAGDADRGRKLFESRSCVQCHAGGSALGPDLSGVTRRFSRSDLLIAILDPSRDVSSRYQTTMIETKDGRVVTGLIVYESVDGLLLRNSTNQTFRIEATDIETRRTLPQSLMPTGLLKGLQPADVADLYAWLKSLEVQSPDR
jgi:putative heme-binding domain-containing protein